MTLINIVSVYSQSQRERLLNGLSENNATEFFPILEAVDWTPEAIDSFKDSVLSKPQLHVCLSDVVSTFKIVYCTSLGSRPSPYVRVLIARGGKIDAHPRAIKTRT